MEINRTSAAAPPAAGLDTGPARFTGFSDPAVAAQNKRDYDALSSSDKTFLEAITGQKLSVGNMPLLGYEVSSDRQTGKLPAGTAISAGYLQQIAEKYRDAKDGQSPLSTEALQRAQEYLAANGGSAGTDFTA